jgi:hypothetical protein
MLFALALVLGAAPAGAQPEAPAPTDPKEMARRHGEEALALHAAGEFGEAYEKFAMAERIVHSPVFVVWMARSARAMGALLDAKRLYQQVAGEVLPRDASPNWTQAKEEAATELAQLAPRIPSVQVRFREGSPRGVIILDGSRIEENAIVEVDPGEHEIWATKKGYHAEKQRVRLEEGQPRLVVELTMTGPRTSGDAPAPEGPSEGSVVPGAVTLGVGLGGVVAGIVTGAYALVLAGEVKDGCLGNRCLASDEDKASDADALARASTGLSIAGGVVGAVGVVLVVVRPGGSTFAAARAGPTWAGLDVRF